MTLAIVPAPLSSPAPRALPANLSESFIEALVALGIDHAFGLIGGAIAGFCDALGRSAMRFVHCQHESGAAFAAAEASLASGRATLVFTTTGPGLLNALTGITAARWEGAKVVLVSAGTTASLRGRGACQETSSYTLPLSALVASGPIFDYAVAVEHPTELEEVVARLASGIGRPGGFVAHVSLPTALQHAPAAATRGALMRSSPPTCPAAELDAYVAALRGRDVVLWVGFGARAAWQEVRAFAERADARVMCSPRAKGVFPERDPRFLGVTGAGGYGDIESKLRARRPDYVVVLGSRLGETTSYWQEEFIPAQSFLHVDIDPSVPGAAYPGAATSAVQSDVRHFLLGMLERWPVSPIPRAQDAAESLAPMAAPSGIRTRDAATGPTVPRAGSLAVRPRTLMDAVQRLVVDASDALVMAEAGNSFIWANHCLRFDVPGRYRTSLAFGSMGHMTAGVVGAAITTRRKAVAVVGDGSMLMSSEISTAVRHGALAVWVVFNDAAYGIVEQGMTAQGFHPKDTHIPRVDFAAIARAIGADGVRVDREDQLDGALAAAMAAPGPFVVDVSIDSSEPAPWMKRIQALIAQGARGGGR